MSKESQDQHSTKEETGEIELELRAAIRAGKAPETRSDTAGWRPSLADTGNGNHQTGLALSQDPGSTAQSAQSSSSEGCVPESLEQEGESPGHASQEVIDENEDLIKLNEHLEGFSTVDSPNSALRHRYKGKIMGAQGFPVSLLACALSFEEPFRFSRSKRPWEELDHWDVGKSTSLLSTVFRSGYSIRYFSPMDKWHIHYLDPMHDEREEFRFGCLFSKRETATFHKTVLQEKRAVVSFRVLRNAPELFSILVLKDEETLPHHPIPDQQFDFDMFWKDYGFLEPNKVTPLTYYLLEICRVFEMCMAAWGETLSTIDNLANVKLEDLNDVGKVENLMFDNSFKRSRDYFVALQILRIIDEWIDEVKSTVENMFKDPVLVPASMWPDGSTESFAVAIRYVNEHVTATKSRVRMKQEEINSLRDGLFNATSLRESMKAMALNQAIYVFTVVTVLFTPVSFLAVGRPPYSSSVTMLTKQTFWALPFLNNPTEGTDVIPVPAAFRNSFIIMPILTYALVIGVAWLVGQRNSSNVVLGMIRDLATSTGRLLRRGWNLLQIGQRSVKRDLLSCN
ncbi:hypothetical protein FPANT_12308 [Fusarium pseudoanthophilum]|uniref:Uncharacterized protein n=1 Tax=Fusarium pseudoanthophilum TaxID=48495 RepID=A0A8H5NP03_9HYPO|nr:hypothetical protein FPANT_12308 [Fusarium pseudoanthophilum]